MLISASGPNVRAALTAARRLANLDLRESRETKRAGGAAGLYQCTLADGTIVKVAVVKHSVSTAEILEQ
jgi:hypothetical protein